MTAVDSTALTRAIPSPREPLSGPVGPVAVPAPVAVPGVGTSRRLVRWVLGGGLVAAFAVTCLETGLPTDRVVLLGWVLAGLTVHAVTDGLRRVGRLLVDWLPLVAVLLAYDASRGLADGLGATVHVAEPAAADRWLGLGQLPTVVLQRHWDAPWWEALAALIYSSHFVVTPLVLAVLWVRNREQWARFARLVVLLSAAGLVTYVLYPAAPPWLAAKNGVIEPVERLSSAGWAVLGLPKAGALLEGSQAQVNPVAAVPSLHTAFAVLVCLALLPAAARSWQRVLLVTYPVLMALVLVWAGEHYVVDTLLGAVYAVAAVALVARARSAAGRLAALVPPRRPQVAAPTVDG
jgi:hypothetical protein